MTGNASEKEIQPQDPAVYSPEDYPPPQEGGYLGSVRFFKHLILAVLALSILIPTALSILFGVSLGRARAELAGLRQAQISDVPTKGQPDGSGDTPRPDGSTEKAEKDEDLKPEVPAYQELYPDLYAQPAERNSVDLEKVVYLTFDDGPSERTPELLEVLERYDVKATFFMLGKDTKQGRQWMRDIVAAGHAIGVHSYTHDYKTIYSSVEAFLDDFAQEYYLIQDATGVPPQIFRFPGGSINGYNGHIYQEIISEMTRRGFVYYDWNRQTGDAARNNVPVDTLVKNSLDQASSMRRVFLLAHDSNRFTNVVEALPRIIEGYREAGFTFDALTPEVKPVICGYLD